MGKSDLKLAEHSWTKGLPRENNRRIENFFHQKMSHIIPLKVAKFQQPLLITLGVADEKPEGGPKKPPPPRDIGLKAFTDFDHFSPVNNSWQKCCHGNKERSISNLWISEFS